MVDVIFRSARTLAFAFLIAPITTVWATAAPASPAPASPTPRVAVYDASQGIKPPAQQDGSTSYLVIGLNPVLGQQVTSTSQSNSSTSKPATTSTSGTSGKAADLATADLPVDACVSAPVATRDAPCTAAMGAVNASLTAFEATLQGTSVTDLQKLAANDLMSDFQLFYTDADGNTSYFTEFANAPTLSAAVAVYTKWIVNTATFSTADISAYDTQAGGNVLNQQLARAALIEGAMTTVVSPSAAYTATAKENATLTGWLQGSTATSVMQAANVIINQFNEVKKEPQITYQIVNSPCGNFGFTSYSWANKLTQTSGAASGSSTTVWENDVTCYPELSVGAMYYVSSLNTDSYVLTATKNSSGTAINVATQVTNNVDQGSFTGALNYCPNGGGNAFCGTINIGSGTDGLTGGIGIGGLFAHRVIGLFGGLRFGQTTVLDSQYTAGVTAVPSGATYTHSKLGFGGFIGVSLNIPTSTK